MEKSEIVRKIEDFAPLETQEKWDCSGWLVETNNQDVKKIMLCLTVTDDVVHQAKAHGCDMIVSHHPLFKINCHSELVSESLRPLIDVYCAHTNLDKANGGTTDTLVNTIFAKRGVTCQTPQDNDFLRYVEVEISVDELLENLKTISPNLR